MGRENRVKCPICGNSDYTFQSKNVINCGYCGIYKISKDNINIKNLPVFSDEEQTILKTYMNRFNDKKCPIINKNTIKVIRKRLALRTHIPNDLLEKFDWIIKDFVRNTKFFGDCIKICKTEIAAPSELSYRYYFCRDIKEFENILKELKQQGYIHYVDSSTTWLVSLTAGGLKYAKSLFNCSTSQQVFVAMWFDNETKDLWNKIKKSIEGNPNEDKNSPNYGANYKALRIDEKEHTNFIPSEIISEIKRSKFMIADLTGYRGGVYYEAGYAEGLGIPVILTCNNDWFEDKKDNDQIIKNGVHFDLKQKNILLWKNDNLTEFQRKLVARIGEVVGFNEK